MDLQQYLRLLQKRWWLILLVVLVGTGSAIYFSGLQPPVYQSTATLLLSPALTREALTADATSNTTLRLAETYARYLDTHAFAELVVENAQLPVSANTFSRAIDARIVEGTLFFEIRATSHAPQQAQRFADAASNYFVQEILNQQQEQQRLRQVAIDVDSSQAVLRDKLERERQYYEGRVEELRIQLRELEQLPESELKVERIAQVQGQLSESEQQLLLVMSDQVALAPQVDNSQINTVTIIERASLPTQPLDEGKYGKILFVLLSTAILGYALAISLEYLDFTIRAPEELELLYGGPVLGVLTSLDNGKQWNEELVVLRDPRSAIAEAFRVMRTNVQFSSADRELRSIVITSAGPGEGKTLTASNLALVLAQVGKRVILVDTDLRRPAVHKRFNLPNHTGFSNLLIAGDPTDPEVIQQHLQTGPDKNLRILSSGPIPPNPAELLSIDKTKKVLDLVEEIADIVIYDTPPVATVTDAAILASRADGTLQVVRAGATRRDLILKARDVLRQVNANVLGPVLNRVAQPDIGHYYYYYYSNYSDNGFLDSPVSTRRTRHGGAASLGSKVRALLLGLLPKRG